MKILNKILYHFCVASVIHSGPQRSSLPNDRRGGVHKSYNNKRTAGLFTICGVAVCMAGILGF